jgi:hypothetical protein
MQGTDGEEWFNVHGLRFTAHHSQFYVKGSRFNKFGGGSFERATDGAGGFYARHEKRPDQ